MARPVKKVVGIEEYRREKSAEAAAPETGELDLSHLEAATVITTHHPRVNLWLVGGGGSGSHAAHSISRLASVLQEMDRTVRVFIVDPDYVEEGNVPRSNFCRGEIGQPKAQALALRYSLAWGVNITAVRKKFHPSMLWQVASKDCLTVIVGAVDNAAARRSINRALLAARAVEGRNHDTWWLDCGNDRDTGQVLLGSACTREDLRGSFALQTICSALPSPAMLFPDLLRTAPPPVEKRRRMSCVEMMLLNEQSLMINQRIANEAGEMLARLLLYRNLQRFATFVDADLGLQRSEFVTPDAVARMARLKDTGLLTDTSLLEGSRSDWEVAA